MIKMILSEEYENKIREGIPFYTETIDFIPSMDLSDTAMIHIKTNDTVIRFEGFKIPHREHTLTIYVHPYDEHEPRWATVHNEGMQLQYYNREAMLNAVISLIDVHYRLKQSCVI